jgi:DNA-binding NarL/FixJ family response regulator
LGYVMKEDAPESMIEGLRSVLAGKMYMSPDMSERVLRGLRDPNLGDAIQSLSRREFQVFSLIADGFGVLEIARKLGLKRKTIETYRKRLKEHLGVSNSNELRRLAVSWARSEMEATARSSTPLSQASGS